MFPGGGPEPFHRGLRPGEKLLNYQQIETLEAVLLVAHDERRLELWRRVDGRWTLEVVRGEGELPVPSLGIALSIEAIYRDPLGA